MAKAKVRPLLVIVGPTASGKTDLAIRLAKLLKGEIIAADAWTLRREADIGSAKPTPAERRQVKHHLIDVIEPNESFSAARFKALANQAIDDISFRHKLPILVGGSGLYIDSVIFNYGFLPEASAEERQRLEALSFSQLHRLAEEKGISLDNFDGHNKRRLIRLIETGGIAPRRQALRPNTLVIGLAVTQEELRRRVINRLDSMLKAGLADEVKDLSERYGWQAEVLKGVGYKQWQDYFLGSQSLSRTKAEIVKATLALAKKQKTWLKRNKSIHWFTTPVKWIDLVELTTTFWFSNVS